MWRVCLYLPGRYILSSRIVSISSSKYDFNFHDMENIHPRLYTARLYSMNLEWALNELSGSTLVLTTGHLTDIFQHLCLMSCQVIHRYVRVWEGMSFGCYMTHYLGMSAYH